MAFFKSKRKLLAVAIIAALALALIAFGLNGLFQHYRTTHGPASAQTTEEPGETKPSETCNEYPATAQQPHKIELPSIGAKGCVQKVGTDKRGVVAAPSNVHVAGWYVNSPAPGQPGISVIDGHVSGRYSKGIFAKLGSLKQGDIVKIQLGNKQKRQFQVVDVKSYPVNEAASHLFQSLKGVNRQLTLITCGGKFDQKSQTYNERVIVRAKAL